jgi:peptide/nickel transport system substrate-binding protein
MSIDPATGKLDHLLHEETTRRELLRRLGLGGAALAIPGLFTTDAVGVDRARAALLAPANVEKEIALINWGIAGTIRNVYLPRSADIPTIYVTATALEGLLSIDEHGRLKPGVAKAWRLADPVTYVYKLRSGVRFWNGDVMTPDDVVFTLIQAYDPKAASQLNTYFTSVKWAKHTGPNEVTIKLKHPEATFAQIPGTYFAQVIQKKYFLAHKKDIGTPGVLSMGTGPYKFTELIPDQSLTLERHEQYWGKKPPVKKIVVKPILQDSTRLIAMRSGELDGVGSFSVPVDQAKTWDGISGVDVQFASSLQLGTLAFNTQKPPWNDVHVRRALAYSVDKAGLVKALFAGHARAANAMPPPAEWAGWLAASEVEHRYAKVPHYAFDLDKAKAELAKSKYPNGFKGTVVYADRDAATLGKACLSLAENVKRLGIHLNVKQITGDAWFALIVGPKDNRLNVTAGQLGADYNDPGENLFLNFHSQYAVNGQYNFANYRNPVMDRMLEAEQRLPEHSAKRAALLFQIMTYLARDLPQLYLWWNDTAMALKHDFVYEGFNPWTWVQPWGTHIRAR